MKEVNPKDIIGGEVLGFMIDSINENYIIFRREDWENAETVYADAAKYAGRYVWMGGKTKNSFKKAKLVCIEEIKQCEHKKVDYQMTYTEDESGNKKSIHKYKCLQCGFNIKPKNGWEVCE